VTSDILHRERNALRMFYGAAVACLFGVFAFFYNAPPLSGEACNDVSLLWVIRAREEEAMRRVVACTSNYREDHAGFLLAGYIMLYVTLQSFAIPGPLVLSVLAGALYPFTFGTILVASCCTSGASVCFLISGHLGVPLLKGIVLELLTRLSTCSNGTRGLLMPQRSSERRRCHFLQWRSCAHR